MNHPEELRRSRSHALLLMAGFGSSVTRILSPESHIEMSGAAAASIRHHCAEHAQLGPDRVTTHSACGSQTISGPKNSSASWRLCARQRKDRFAAVVRPPAA